MVGSIAMLIGFLALYLVTGTFNFTELAAARPAGGFGPLLARRLNGSFDPELIGTIVF